MLLYWPVYLTFVLNLNLNDDMYNCKLQNYHFVQATIIVPSSHIKILVLWSFCPCLVLHAVIEVICFCEHLLTVMILCEILLCTHMLQHLFVSLLWLGLCCIFNFVVCLLVFVVVNLWSEKYQLGIIIFFKLCLVLC
jgi:hypothetical protein